MIRTPLLGRRQLYKPVTSLASLLQISSLRTASCQLPPIPSKTRPQRPSHHRQLAQRRLPSTLDFPKMATTSGSGTERHPLFDLFDTLKESFQNTQLGSDRWYMCAAASIVGGNDPERCDQLYLYLCTQPEFQTPAQRQGMVRRVREALFKAICIVGVCKPLEAIMAINKVEREEDKDPSPATREGWKCDEANLERGMDWMKKIYTGNTDSTLDLYKDHKDFAWVSRNITYGLYLSDRQVLDDLDTEIVVFSGIMIQNLKVETHWHIRGIRRLGVAKKDVEVLWNDVQKVAAYFELKLNRVPTVESVEYDV